jgi:hypothetical protein
MQIHLAFMKQVEQKNRKEMRFFKNSIWIFMLTIFSINIYAQDLSTFSTKTPIKVAGSLSGRSTFYTSQNLRARRVPFSWQVSGGATITLLNGLQVPFSFIISEQNRSFSQPFNQFGMSPRYKGYTLHAGYRNLTFSEFTLAGQSVFGGGGEIQKGNLRAGFMAGRFNRASAGIESLTPTFYRQGWAGRVGYGKNDNFIDLIVLSASDRKESIANYTNIPGFNPEQNSVVGINFRKQFLKRITLSAETAVSLYTNDLTARALDSLNLPAVFDEYAPNISSEPALAIRSSLEYRGNAWGIGFGFQQIDAGFRSMGAYYLYNDMQMISASPNFSLLGGKINVNGSVMLQKDNLKKSRPITTNRLSPTVGFGLNFSQNFGLDIQGQLFKTNQTIINEALAKAENLQNNSLYSLTATPRWNLNQKTIAHSINLTGGWQSMKDQNPLSKEYTQFNSVTGGFFYVLSLIPSQTNINIGANYAGFNTLLISSKPTFSFNSGANRSFDKGKYSATANASYSISEFSKATNVSSNFSYQINKHNQITASINGLWLKLGNDNKLPSGKEQRGTINYTHRF